MAERKPKPGKTRYRRTDDEMIADLRKQIADLEQRKSQKELKNDPDHKDANAAFRALTKAVENVKSPDNADLKRALSEAQRILADYFESKGLNVPKARKPRRRRARP